MRRRTPMSTFGSRRSRDPARSTWLDEVTTATAGRRTAATFVSAHEFRQREAEVLRLRPQAVAGADGHTSADCLRADSFGVALTRADGGKGAGRLSQGGGRSLRPAWRL